ncbi:MAG: Eco47II family restriction endonuclease, partial [Bacteroidales bacterium]
DPKSTCMLVEVIAKKSQDIPWVINLDGERQSPSKKIRRVSIDKFYELVTGDKDAFVNLCQVIPQVIKDVVGTMKLQQRKNTVYDELSKISDDLLTSIYLLSFKRYEGFKDFKIEE